MLYFEDLTPGRVFETASHTLSQDEIISFARQFDPQPFHTDPEAAKTSVFDGLAASGWHTSSLTMRLITASELRNVANGLIGMGIKDMRWPQPTRAGDTLRATIEVLAQKPSSSKPGFGVVQLRWTTLNQRDEIAMQLETSIWVARRSTAEA
ncbi:MaoC family dehydratase [Aquitalea sp. LB_tupeE]|uniref:MaoC family dehydratase n=1 Tax=Aquitalea sp. LB_tupeE TaxID=2748078 RepID=UPI0015BD116A|nr:MaoC family dehydratase [Aquitalea sp. LB_tupeE]NWK79256.1 MaoC family dehydratase [Aquitalea sp. LB_tupeE]